MANKKVLITSSGCYAVSEKGTTVELVSGDEVLIEDFQASVFIKAGKAELVVNKKKAVKKISGKDSDVDEGDQDDETDNSLGGPLDETPEVDDKKG
tara:strand:+ start:112 stop:399 length:288 start_codon:yes stop_codon:yes gene_type:complete